MPDVSIILLTKNGLPKLEQTLAAIFAQKTARSFQVLAIDSGSVDGTLELLSRYPICIKQIQPAEFNFGATRALGYDLARGQILLTLSQDAVPADEHWLEKLTAPFDDPQVAAVTGGVRRPPHERIFYWQGINQFYFIRSSRRWKARYGFGFSNVNSAIRRDIWVKHRIGAAEVNEDKVLQKIWTARNLKIVRAPQAAVFHTHDYDLRSLMQRCENEGLGQRLVGLNYSFTDALADMLNLRLWKLMLKALWSREITTPAEMLFPLIRPSFTWKGNHFNKKYVHRV